jgi:hypothetical protein
MNDVSDVRVFWRILTPSHTSSPLHICTLAAMRCHFQVCGRNRTRLPQHQSVQLIHPRNQRLVKRNRSHAPCVQQYCEICRSRRRKEKRFGTLSPSILPFSALFFFFPSTLSVESRTPFITLFLSWTLSVLPSHYFALDVLTPFSPLLSSLHCLLPISPCITQAPSLCTSSPGTLT